MQKDKMHGSGRQDEILKQSVLYINYGKKPGVKDNEHYQNF